jgi:hypothetical protein
VFSVSRERKRKKVPRSWGKRPEQESPSRGKPERGAAGDSTQRGRCGDEDGGWEDGWRGGGGIDETIQRENRAKGN